MSMPLDPPCPTLFPIVSQPKPLSVAAGLFHEDATSGLRLKTPRRNQLIALPLTLDDLLLPDHPARAIFAVVDAIDFSSLFLRLQCRGSNAGAPAIDPRITLALWVFGVSEGNACAAELARRCVFHDAYRWIAGGVSVSVRHLSTFRSESGELFSELVTQLLALCLQKNLIDLSRTAHDGSKVRTSAGANSFHRDRTLADCEKEAREHLAAVLNEAPDVRLSAVRKAAIKRGARDFLARVEEARALIPELQAIRDRNAAIKKSKARDASASTTDPEARFMKMPDGGKRPAYNIQFAVTTDEARVIVGYEVSNDGADASKAVPMVAQIEARLGQRPKELLVDGGIATQAAVDALAPQVKVVGPLFKAKPGQRAPEQARPSDSPAVAEYRARMQTPESKELYKLRAATIETVNADLKTHRGLDRLLVRGIHRVKGAVGLAVLTYNILRLIKIDV